MKTLLTLALVASMAALASAQVKVSELPAASSLSGGELIPAVQSGTTKRTTPAQIASHTISLAAGVFAPINSPTFTGTPTVPGYQTADNELAALASLANAAGMLTNNGSGTFSYTATTTGGNGAADSGKIAVYGSNGELAARSYFRTYDSSGVAYTSLVSNGVSGFKNSQFLSINWPGTPTSARTYTLPDGTGTIHVNGQALGTPASATLTNATGLPMSGLTGTLAAFNAVTSDTDAAGLGLANNYTANVALSAPTATFSGTWLTSTGTSTTLKPTVLIEGTGTTSTAWHTSGTGLGINAPSGFTGNLLDMQINGVPYFSVAPGIIYVRASDFRLTNGAVLWFGATSTIDVSVRRVNGTTMSVYSASGNSELRVFGDTATGTGSSKYASLKHDGTNAILHSATGYISTTAEQRFAAGVPLSIATGTGARAGNATLVAGTVTVTNTTTTAATLVVLTRKTAGGTIGDLTYTVSAGASFTINSANAADTSTVTYLLIENP